jgi:O-antigen/teichoic acid export membrane protein
VTRLSSGSWLRNLPAASLGWNILGGVWSGGLLLVATPVLVAAYGLDRFGLIGLWMTLQVVLGLVDFGLSSTLGRQLARSVDAASEDDDSPNVLVTFETVTWLVSTAILLVALYIGSSSDRQWLDSKSIPQSEVDIAVGLMIAALGLQFPSLLYSGGLIGVSRHKELNTIQILVNTVRWAGGAALAFGGAPLVSFFGLQAATSLFQSFALRTALRSAMQLGREGHFLMSVLKRHSEFAVGMAGTSVLAVIIANADRVLISVMLSTEDIGRYSVAFIACGVIQMLLTPFYRVYFPKFSLLAASKKIDALQTEYFSSCRWLATFMMPTVLCLCMFSEEVLSLWLGTADHITASVLVVLAGGVGAASLSWLQGALQQAFGTTSLHLGMLALAVLVGLPIALFCISRFGIVGATALWVVHGLISLTVEPWLMHRRFLRGQLALWYRSALLVPFVASTIVVMVAKLLMPDNLGRWGAAGWLIATGIIAITSATFVQTLAFTESRDE